MIVQKEFLNKLKDFGLNSYEAKLWTALLSRGVSTAGELSDISNVPRSRSYDVLESLEKKGFVITNIGKPIKYIAVSPEEVIERIKKKVKEESEEQETLINELKKNKIFDELTLLHTQGIESIEPQELTGAFKDRISLYNHLDFIIKNAKQSVVISTTESGMIRKYEKLRKSMEKAKERGVKIKFIAPITKQNIETVKKLLKIAEIKDSKSISRFIVADGKEVVIILMDDAKIHSSYDIGVWLNTKYFASVLQRYFDMEWSNLKSFKE